MAGVEGSKQVDDLRTSLDLFIDEIAWGGRGDFRELLKADYLIANDRIARFYGLPVPADQDGNPVDPVRPDAVRVCEFELPLGSAGTYWYHPHAHGTTAAKVARGLAGAFVVCAPGGLAT